MKPQKTALLVLYIIFMVGMILLIVLGTLNVIGSRAVPMTTFLWLFFIVFAVMGGVVAKGSDRSVAGWAIGCLFLPFVLPLVLALLKDKEAVVSRASAGAGAGSTDFAKQRKRQELVSLKEKGLLTQAEYETAMQKLVAGGTT